MVEEFEDVDIETDAMNDMDRFDQRHGAQDSSDEDQMAEFGRVEKPKSEVEVLFDKNRILMERLVKA